MDFHVLLMGSEHTGKSTFISNLVGLPQAPPLGEVLIRMLNYSIRTNRGMLNLTLRDTQGQHNPEGLETFEGAHGALIFYDVGLRTTAPEVRTWWSHLPAELKEPGMPVVVVGNKVDDIERRHHTEFPIRFSNTRQLGNVEISSINQNREEETHPSRALLVLARRLMNDNDLVFD